MRSTVKVIADSLPERVDRSGAAKAHGAVFNIYRMLVVKAAASRTQNLVGSYVCCDLQWFDAFGSWKRHSLDRAAE